MIIYYENKLTVSSRRKTVTSSTANQTAPIAFAPSTRYL